AAVGDGDLDLEAAAGQTPAVDAQNQRRTARDEGVRRELRPDQAGVSKYVRLSATQRQRHGAPGDLGRFRSVRQIRDQGGRAVVSDEPASGGGGWSFGVTVQHIARSAWGSARVLSQGPPLSPSARKTGASAGIQEHRRGTVRQDPISGSTRSTSVRRR